MEFVPFIYFSILFLAILKKRGFDVGAYVTLLYVITSFAAVILLQYEPRYRDYVTFFPTIEYCFLLTAFIWPLNRFSPAKISKVTFSDTRFVKSLIVFYFVITVLILVAYHEDFVARFVATEVLNTRGLISEGYAFLTPYPRMIQIILNFLMIFGAMSYMLIFVFFFNVCYLHLGKIYNLLTILGSLCAIVVGILGMDRSKTLFWLLLSGLCCVMFWKHLKPSAKKGIFVGGTVLIVFLLSYFAFVTINRFGQGEDKEESVNSVIGYAGQPYLQFCLFSEQLQNPDGITFKYLMPMTHIYILKDYKGSVDHQQRITKKTGVECGVFCTVIGDFIVSDGLLGPFIITLVYLFLCRLVFRRKRDTISFRRFFISYAVMIIPCVGIITYLYNNENTTLPLYLMLIIMSLMREKNARILCAS